MPKTKRLISISVLSLGALAFGAIWISMKGGTTLRKDDPPQSEQLVVSETPPSDNSVVSSDNTQPNVEQAATGQAQVATDNSASVASTDEELKATFRAMNSEQLDSELESIRQDIQARGLIDRANKGSLSADERSYLGRLLKRENIIHVVKVDNLLREFDNLEAKSNTRGRRNPT